MTPRHYIIREIDDHAQLLGGFDHEDKARAFAVDQRKAVPAHRVVLASVRFEYINEQTHDPIDTPREVGTDGGGALERVASVEDGRGGEGVRPVGDEASGQNAKAGLASDHGGKGGEA